MTAANRRYTRYAIPENSLQKQQIKTRGCSVSLRGGEIAGCATSPTPARWF